MAFCYLPKERGLAALSLYVHKMTNILSNAVRAQQAVSGAMATNHRRWGQSMRFMVRQGHRHCKMKASGVDPFYAAINPWFDVEHTADKGFSLLWSDSP